MKKLFNILILFGLLFAFSVKADSSGPMFPLVPAEVKNDNAKCYSSYDFTGKYVSLNKGQSIKVRYVSDEKYEYDSEDEEVGYCFIKASDLSFGKTEYKLSREDKLYEPLDLMVVSDSGAQMYSGPLEEYSKLDVVIPKGTVLKTYYRVGTSWYYVNYNEIDGYVTGMKRDVVYSNPEEEYYKLKRYAIDDLDIEDSNAKKIGTLPALTEISEIWETDAERKYYITYNDISGFVGSYSSFSEDCTGTKLKPLSKVSVYKTIEIGEQRNPVKVGTAEANKTYDVKYCFVGQGESGYYISSLNGWIYFDYDDKTDYIETDKEGTVYDTREARKRHVLEKIEVEGYELYFQKNIYSYRLEVAENVDKLNIIVTPGDESIYVDIKNNENLKNNSQVSIYVSDDDGGNTYTITVLKRSAVEPQKQVEPTKGDSNNTILWICLGAALLLVITTIVIIILVNKKRKNKNEELKEETKEVLGEQEKNTVDIEENTNETKL